jgi:hypothetical protein
MGCAHSLKSPYPVTQSLLAVNETKVHRLWLLGLTVRLVYGCIVLIYGRCITGQIQAVHYCIN